LSPIFNILPAKDVSENASLFCEVSNESLSYFLYDIGNYSVETLTVFHFHKIDPEHNVSGLIKKIFDEQPLLKNNYGNVFISYAFNESILTPEVYYNKNLTQENIVLLYGDLNTGIILTDKIEGREMCNIYRVHNDIHEVISGHFPAAKYSHQYSWLIKQLPQAGNIMKVIFYQNKIVIILVKNDQLQIMQTFNYITAEDVVYHMLNICHQFQAEQVTIELGGMIEKDSNLFTQIHKYFLRTTFSNLPDRLKYVDGIKDYPLHFFGHLFSIALCV
jgi:hypothetical protein